jgi:ABC-2 type transport system permease protein
MIHVIIKETKDFLREKTNLFFFLMFPVVLVFLLGNLLGSMDKAENPIGEIKLQYLVKTDNVFHKMAIESFVKAMEDDKNIFFERSADLEASKLLAGRDEITAVIEFTGDPLTINIYEGTNNIKNRTVGAIMNGFIQSNKSISAVIKTAPNALTGGISEQGEYVKQKDLGINRTMLDYYAVTMMVMICFMSIILGSTAFMGERQNKTINRLMIAPKNKIILFLSKILGLLPQTILQILIIMISSVFVFNAHYSASLPDNLYLFVMFFIVTIAMISIGAVLGLFIKANPMAVIFPALWVMMFLSGTYSKSINISGVTNLMPIYQVQEAAFDLTVFGRYGRCNIVIISCIIITIIMLSLGAFAFSRKEEER